MCWQVHVFVCKAHVTGGVGRGSGGPGAGGARCARAGSSMEAGASVPDVALK